MAVFIGNAGNNIANATGAGLLVGFAGGNIAQLQDGIGDLFVAFGGNDQIVAGNGNDVILGGDGNDFIDGRFGFDVMDGGNGIDTMDVSFFAGAYVWNMATGVTNFSAAGEFAFNFENARTGAGNDQITGSGANNNIFTGAGNDTIDGAGGNDTINGGDGDDRVFGGVGNDVLLGGNGNDILNGGAGNDTMNGGAGFDIFDYNAITDSGAVIGVTDIIAGFQNVVLGAGFIDRIDLSTIDANPLVVGNQAFGFSDVAPPALGQVGWFNFAGNTFVRLNTDLDASPEMLIQLNGIYNLDAVDFIL